MGHEYDFFDRSRRVTIDHGVFFTMKAPAISGFLAVAPVVKARCVPVVADR